jgi:hypothetical protein
LARIATVGKDGTPHVVPVGWTDNGEQDTIDVGDQTTVGRRNRAFEASEMVDAFNALERRLASPAGDTRHSPPARAVPQGRPKRRPAH